MWCNINIRSEAVEDAALNGSRNNSKGKGCKDIMFGQLSIVKRHLYMHLNP